MAKTTVGPGMRAAGIPLLAALLAGEAPARADAPRKLLLVDDFHVLYRPGTVSEVGTVSRHPRPFIVADRPWEGMIGYSSVHRDAATGRYQLWYQAYGGGAGGKVCYAESPDGLEWTKPELGLHPHRGSTRNNIVLPGGSDSYGASVVWDPRDSDPARRYKMAKWEMPKGHEAPWPGLHVAFSPDGIHWTRYRRPGSPPPEPHGSYDLTQLPLIHGSYGRKGPPPFANDPDYKLGASVSVSDVIDLSYDPRRELFMIFAKTWVDGPTGESWKRAVVRTESRDFIQWSKPELALSPDEHDGIAPGAYGGSRTGVQLHGGPAFFHHDAYFCLLQVVDFERTGEMPVELAISRDGIRWERPFRDRPFLPVMHGRAFDGAWMMSNATPVILEHEIQFYYSGYESPWNSYAPGYQFTGVGRATLPMDRFAAIRPAQRVGQITLKPIAFAGIESITVNANASGGEIRAEILDEGYRVRGYTRADALPLHGDSLAHRLAWKGRGVSDLPPGRYLLRLHLENAEVYAVTLHPSRSRLSP